MIHTPPLPLTITADQSPLTSITPPLLSRVLITFTITTDTLRIPQLHHQTIHNTFDYTTQLNAPPRRDAEVADANGRPRVSRAER